MFNKRTRARKKIEQGLYTLHQVLIEQRGVYEKVQPEPAAIASTVGPPLGVDGVHARRRVAYSELSNSEAAYRNALVVVRAVEAEANPLVLSSPAVIGLAVSAPGTSGSTGPLSPSWRRL